MLAYVCSFHIATDVSITCIASRSTAVASCHPRQYRTILFNQIGSPTQPLPDFLE